MMVNAGFAASALGKTELSQTQRFLMVCERPKASTTESLADLPILQVPIVCAERCSVQQSLAPAACQAAVRTLDA